MRAGAQRRVGVRARVGVLSLGFLVAAGPLAGATQPAGSPAALVPILECVAPKGDGTFTAHFSYRNDGGSVDLPAGPGNRLSPGPEHRGQPTSFSPGRTGRYPAAAFAVDFDGRDLGWTLVGPDGRARTATASAGSRRCAAAADLRPPRVFIGEPADGSFVATTRPRLSVEYEDDGGLDLASLEVRVDGVLRTSSFRVDPRRAVDEGPLEPALAEGPHRIEAKVRDRAGRVGSAAASFTVDTEPPRVTVVDPGSGSVASAPAVDVSGGVTDASPVRVTVGVTDAAVTGGSFRAVGVPLGDGPDVVLPVVARDAAGNAATAEMRLRIDRRPAVVRITSPADGATVRGPRVRVAGTVTRVAPVEVNGRPATVEGEAFTAVVEAGAGPLVLEAVARGAVGVASTHGVTVTVDTAAPGLVVESPTPDAVTSASSLRVAGRVDDPQAAVRVNGAPARVEGGAFVATVPLPREGRQTVLVTAEDPAGNRREVELPLRVDRTPPGLDVLSLSGGPVDGRVVPVAGAVEDAGAVSVTVNGRRADRLERGFKADLSGLPPGRQVVEVVARDEAGNETRSRTTITVAAPAGPVVVVPAGGRLRDAASPSARTLTLAAQRAADAAAPGEGVVVGQVLDDASGLPVEGATVRLDPGGLAFTTDPAGVFRLAAGAGPAVLTLEKAGLTTVYRSVVIEEGVGLVAVDARLLPAGEPVAVDAAGAVLSASFARRLRPAEAQDGPPPATLTVTLPPGSVAGAGGFRLTALSPQGLPDLLPLGTSPVLAWNLDGPTPPASAAIRATSLPPLPLQLVAYDTSLHAWLVEATDLAADTGGVLEVTTSGLGTWALVTLDPAEPPPALPGPGGTLPAAPFAAIPEGAVGRSFADPPSLPATGGTAHGRIEVDSPSPLPSGTVVQAVVSESYTLANGETATGDERSEDVLLYRADLDGVVVPEAGPVGLAAQLPIVASRQLAPTELSEGRVRLRVLAGREGVRAAGGGRPVVVTSGGATLKVPGGALPQDTAVSLVRAGDISSFVPRPAGFTPIAEVTVDLSGATLALAAELSVPAAGAPPGGSLFVARVERVGAETRLSVVAWAERDGNVIATRPRAPLPGILQGGRYVVYHAVPPVGFLAGTTRAAGAPVPAVVSTSGLPFVGIAGLDGAYSVLTLAGPVRASARVLGTALEGTADAAVAAGSVAPLDIDLARSVTVGVVTPAHGATGVPVTRQIEIEASEPLDPTTAVPASVRLRRTSDGAPRAVRTVLSADGRSLAVIPEAPLAYLTSYTFESTGGLLDVHGGPVAMPIVEFTTEGEAVATLDLDAIVFSYPVGGMVTMRVPAGALPSGTQILVINASAGSAASVTVGGQPVETELRASIQDRLWVTVTDPQGRATTFERTEYVAPDGKTAVGVAGGKVKGPGGLEMRLPPGATKEAVTIRLSSFGESQLAGGRTPELPGARFGAGLRIESADEPRFEKEVDLVFPRPAAAPEGAFFYVYRKVDLPGGRVAFETIDQAFAEGGKVVTASFPFLGYTTSFGAYGAGGLSSVAANYVALMWTYDELMPGKALSGAITGQVLRAVIDPETGELSYEGIPGVTISGVNEAGFARIDDPDSDGVTSATSGDDGVFTLLDARYTGGLVQLSAQTPRGEVKRATAYQTNPMDAENHGLRFFPNVARVTFTFEPETEPPQPGVVDVTLVRVGSDGRRQLADSLVVEGSRLLVGVRRRRAEVEAVTIDGQPWPFASDAAAATEPLSFDLVTSGEFVASPPGLHRVDVLAHDVETGAPRTASLAFRVVVEGGGSGEPLPGEDPVVLSTYPRAGARAVPVTTLPQVQFSEPVRSIPTHVHLYERGESGETEVAVRLLGVPPGGSTPVDVTPPVQSSVAVVSLAIQPLPGLRFGKEYRLSLSPAIVDLDLPLDGGPRPLSFPDLVFGTETLDDAIGGGGFPSPGVAVQDGWAYLAHDEFTHGTLKVFDVRQPTLPRPVPSADRPIENRPVDLAVRPRRLLVGTTVPARSVPSNLQVFDVSRPDDPRWVGAASVSSGVLDGTLRRVVAHGKYAYGLVYRKGVQVVDIAKAEANFAATGGPTQPAYWQMKNKLNTDGQGFGMDAVVVTLPLPVTYQEHWYLHDLDVADYVVGAIAQPLAFVAAEDRLAGTCSLLAGSPVSVSFVSRTRLQTPEGEDLCPVLVALGRVAGRDVAVVGVALGPLSYDAEGYGLAVVDLEDPTSPELVGFTRLDLPDLSDLTLEGDRALVASSTSGTEIVELGDPLRPYAAGRIRNLSGRLAVGEDATYFSAGGNFGDSPQGGLHVANVGSCDLLELREDQLLLDAVRDPLDGALCGGGDVLVFSLCKASRVTLQIDDRVATLGVDDRPPAPLADLPLGPGTHVVTVPFGTIGSGIDTVKPFILSAEAEEDPSLTAARQGEIRNKLLNRPVLPVGRTFVKGVDLFDGHVVRQATDVKVQGRHLGLEVTRTYSSAAKGEDGTLGAGWGWNYSAAVARMSCGLVNVSTADGGGQVFRATNDPRTFTPQPGYHGTLTLLAENIWEYVDKAGVKHFYEDPVDPAQPDGARRFDRMVEPHGDRVEVAYDLLGRVASVREVLRGERPVRSLEVRYTHVRGHDRVSSVESSLGHRVEYGYDAEGNLSSVRRLGANVDGGPDAEPQEESYEYDTASLRDPHQMTAAVGPNRDRTEYAYHRETDTVAGEAVALAWIVSSKEELAKRVVEVAADTPEGRHATEFAYDFSAGTGNVYTTTVTDARGNATSYTLNNHGSPTRILEPLGKETLIGWQEGDILKKDERDALGRLTRFEYDPRGNLRLETIEKAGQVLAETEYRYDPSFNKLTYKKDAEGRVTEHTIDSTTGDLTLTVDAVLNRTEYHYDADGRLEWTKDPRGFVTHFRSFNDFGSARETENALGQVTYRTYDSRNRPVVERQEPYARETRTSFDGFDRPVETVRDSDGPVLADERTLVEYYAGGQPRVVENALGARTEYALDGMNRIVGTSVQVDAETLTTETRYDGNGNVVFERDRRGIAKANTYDALNRLTRVDVEEAPGTDGPLGPVAAFGYDLVGNKTSETDVNGFVTELRYDGLYHLERKILPVTNLATSLPYEEGYRHDKVGNLERLVDANGKATETEYDGLNRVTKVTRDRGGLDLVATTSYLDPEGSRVNTSEEKDVAKGLRTTFLYDALGRETERKVHLEGDDGDPLPNPGPYVTTTVYEDSEHAARVTDPRGVTTLQKLDGLDRVIELTVDRDGLAPTPALNLTTRFTYDGLGNKLEVWDPEDRPTSHVYDSLGRLVTTTDAMGQEAWFRYFGDGLKRSQTDRRDVQRLFEYDSLKRPRKARLAAAPFSGVGWTKETRYVDGPQPKRIEIDAMGRATTFDLDGLGRVVKEEDPLGHSRIFTWDGVNRVAETDKRGFTTQFEYDGINRLVKTTDPPLSGDPGPRRTVVTTYEDAGNRVMEKDRRGYLDRRQMDPLGRVVRVTAAVGEPEEGVLETNVYDPNGNKTLATDAEGRKTRFEYDAANRLVAREDGFSSPAAATTTFAYDRVGNLLEERDARAAALGEPWSVLRTYDDLNRLNTETDGERNTTIMGWDPEGNRASVTTPRRTVTSYLYDELGKLTRVTQPTVLVHRSGGGGPSLESVVTSYVHDENRNRIRQTDANGHVVAMEYDELNRLKRTIQDPRTGDNPTGLDLVSETVRFDENGNPEIVRDPKGQTVTSTFDELNRLKSKTHAFAAGDALRPWRYTASVDYVYDENGNLLQTDEHVASGTDPPQTTLTTTRTFDPLDRLTSETQPLPDGGGRTIGYAYYRNGLRRTVTDPSGSVTQYGYDGQNRLEMAVTGFGTADARTTAYTYWPDDLLKAVSYPNGVVATHEYDKADRLLSLTNAKDATALSSYQYSGIHPTSGLPVSYDANGNRLIQIETNGGLAETTTYAYDDLDRLASVSYPVDTAHPSGRVVSYGYDAVGNRARETEKDSTDSILADKQGFFDNANRLTELEDLVNPAEGTSFTWDPNGNQLTKTTAGVTTENRYDLRDKLVEVVQGASILGRFQYDPQGRRSLKIGEGLPGDTLRQYVYDQTSLLAEYDAAGSQKAKYDYGSDRLISLTIANEGRRYFSLDGLRSVVNLTNDDGLPVASYHLDAWGNFRFPNELTQSANRFAFTGHIWDQETGLYNAKARYFDPKLGRFLTQDSYLGQIDQPPSLHRYAYGWNRPTYFIDPTGHAVLDAKTIEDLQRSMDPERAGLAPTGAPPLVEHPRTTQTRSLPAEEKERLAKGIAGADRLLSQLEQAGISHIASITIEEGDFTEGGSLNVGKILDQVTKRVGSFAWEREGLREAFEQRLAGATAGSIVGISDLYSEAFLYSTQRTLETADVAASQGNFLTSGIKRDATLLGLAREGKSPEGFGLEGAAGLGLTAYGDVGLAQAGLALGRLGVRGLGRFALSEAEGGVLATIREKVASLAATRARMPPYQFGNTGGALGTTDKFGNITVQRGLSGKQLEETVRHEAIHRFLSPDPGGLIQGLRADFGVGAYQRSALVRYLEEGLAEGFATRSALTGFRYPVQAGYVTANRVLIEAGLYAGGTSAAAYGGYTWSSSR